MRANIEALIQLDDAADQLYDAAKNNNVELLNKAIERLEKYYEGTQALSEALFIAIEKNYNLPVVKELIERIENSDEGIQTLSEALMIAAYNGNIDAVQELMAVKGIDFYARDEYNDTALMIAAYEGKTDIVQAFIKKLENTAEDIQALSEALFIAIEKNDNLPVVQAFIEKLKNTDKGKKTLSEALLKAVILDNSPVVKELIAVEGIDFNAEDGYDYAALMIAVYKGKADIVQAFIEKLKKSKEGQKALREALKAIGNNDDSPVVKDDCDYAALIVAAQKNNDSFQQSYNLPVVQAFIEKLQNSAEGKEALSNLLIEAVYNDRIDAVQELIAVEGIDFNARDEYNDTALMIAACEGKTDIVQAFIKKLKNTDKGREALSEALFVAARGGKIDVVRKLIAVNGIKLNARDRNGDTALFLAARYSRSNVVQALIEKLENSAEDNQVLSEALIVAAKRNYNSSFQQNHNLSTVKALIEKFENSAEDIQVLSEALLKAVISDNLPVVQELIAKLENTDKGREALSEALFVAARDGKIDVVRKLIAVNGIKLNARDRNGDTALFLAARHSRSNVVQALIEKLENSAEDNQVLSEALIAAAKINYNFFRQNRNFFRQNRNFFRQNRNPFQQNHNLSIVKALIEKFENSEKDIQVLSKALLNAVTFNNLPVVKELIAKLENSAKGKKTLSKALIVAAKINYNSFQQNHNLSIVKALIEKFGNSAEDIQVLSEALLKAVIFNNLPVVQELIAKLENSAEDNQVLSEALIVAAQENYNFFQQNHNFFQQNHNLSIVKALIEKFGNSAEDIQVLSEALLKAVIFNNLPVVKELIAKLENSAEGKKTLSKALSWAEVKNNKYIMNLLKDRAESIKQENLSSSTPSEGSTDEVGGTEPTDTLPPTTTASSAGPEEFNSGQPRPEQESSTASTNTSESGGLATSGAEVGRDTPKAEDINPENLDRSPPTTTASSAGPEEFNSGQAKSEQESSTASTNTSESGGLATSGAEVGRDTPKAEDINPENLDRSPPIITASSAAPGGSNSGRAKPEQDSSTASTNTSKSGVAATSGAGTHSTDNSDKASDEELESSKKPGPYLNKQQLLTCLASTATCTAVAYGLFVQGAFPVMWDLYSVLAGGTVVGAIFALMLIRSVKVGGDDVARSTYDHPDTPQPGQQCQI
jgi:ankyrin repeat protein